MRRTWASALLLVLVAAMFVPLASASIPRDAHACCHKAHDQAMFQRQMPCGPGQHSCCGATVMNVAAAPAARPMTAAKPAKSHPFLVEFYQDADSSVSATRQADRAPPADLSHR
jgi:hypothetical protein